MNKDYYKILGIDKNSNEDEIKKAYRKQAMQWHPDKHKWDKKAEEKFKEINEAYQILWDTQKRKQYDTFGSAWNNFSWFGGWQGFSWFEDLFKNAWSNRQSYSSQEFDMWDIFGDLFGQTKKKKSSFDFSWFGWWNNYQSQAQPKKEEPKLDVEKIYEVPVFDLILGTKLDVQTVYSENLKLKIPEWTKPWTKFKIKWKWRSSNWKTGDMYVIIETKMPKNIPEDVRKLLESIKYRL